MLDYVLNIASKNPKILEVYLNVQTRYELLFLISLLSHHHYLLFKIIFVINSYHSSFYFHSLFFNLILFLLLSNEGAKDFYLSSGFKVIDMIKDYYKRIDPPDSYLLEKKLRDI